MNIEEIKKQLEIGEKVTHTSFMPHEYVYRQGCKIHTEDGYSIEEWRFWMDRQESGWDYGWDIYRGEETIREKISNSSTF